MATSNVNQIVVALERLGPDVEAAGAAELDVVAQLIARRMRNNAPKYQSVLVNSIHVEAPALLEREIRPGVAYAEAVEKGVRAGGRGLPKWTDPAADGIKAWLESKAFKGVRRPRSNSMKAVARMLELRDRYEGLAWHVRHHGVKAQPFVAPTMEQMAPVVRVRLMGAVQAAMRASAAQNGGQA